MPKYQKLELKICYTVIVQKTLGIPRYNAFPEISQGKNDFNDLSDK